MKKNVPISIATEKDIFNKKYIIKGQDEVIDSSLSDSSESSGMDLNQMQM